MLAGEPSSTTSEPPARLKLDMGKLQRLLSESESKVALAPRWSTTRLHAVVEADDTEAVGLLLRSGACADVNAPNPRLASTESEGWRALHAAAQRGETAMLALLLSHGANLHATTRNNVTALHVAAFHGRLGAVKLLIARGADAQLADSNGYTALDNAKYQSVDCACKQASAERQREWGACIAFLERAGRVQEPEKVEAFARASWELLVSDVLQRACEADAPPSELPRLLACYAKEVNARDFDGSAPLHAAALAGRDDAVQLLLVAKADVNATTKLNDTPLHFAAREGHLAATRRLLAGQADPNATTRFGRTPLDEARRGHEDDEWRVLEVLLLDRMSPSPIVRRREPQPQQTDEVVAAALAANAVRSAIALAGCWKNREPVHERG